MISSPSLYPLFPSAVHVCQLGGESRDAIPERRESNRSHRRRIYGNMDMPLNSSRLPLNPGHAAAQVQGQHRTEAEQAATQPQRRTAPAVRTPPPSRTPTPPPSSTPTPPPSGTPTPPPLDVPAPLRAPSRRGTAATLPLGPNDTRRHGIILADSTTPSDELPSYTPLLFTPYRRVSTSGTPSDPIDARTIQGRQSRQQELSSLQHQWATRRRRTYPLPPSARETERTHFRALVSEAYDLPPPYAAEDPYPLFKDEERRPSFWGRVGLGPFKAEGEVVVRAVGATERVVAKVGFRVRTKVEEVGRKARAVPGRIEGGRARRKIRWLEGRGYVEVERERVGVVEGHGGRVPCGAYAGAQHVVSPVESSVDLSAESSAVDVE